MGKELDKVDRSSLVEGRKDSAMVAAAAVEKAKGSDDEEVLKSDSV